MFEDIDFYKCLVSLFFMSERVKVLYGEDAFTQVFSISRQYHSGGFLPTEGGKIFIFNRGEDAEDFAKEVSGLDSVVSAEVLS